MKSVRFRRLYAEAEQGAAPVAILTHWSYPYKYMNSQSKDHSFLLVVDTWYKHHLTIDLWLVVFTVSWETFKPGQPKPPIKLYPVQEKLMKQIEEMYRNPSKRAIIYKPRHMGQRTMYKRLNELYPDLFPNK